MLFVAGASGITLAFLLYGIVLLACRRPVASRWASDFLVGNIYVPVIISFIAIGVGCMVEFGLGKESRAPSLLEVISAIGVVAVGLFLLKMLRIKKRLADYAATAAAGKVIQPQVWQTEPVEMEPPLKPTSGQKAA